MKPAGKLERLYDRRSSSLTGDLAFFIKPTFWAGRRARDDSNDIALVGVGNGKEPPPGRKAERDPAVLADGVIGVGARERFLGKAPDLGWQLAIRRPEPRRRA